MEIIYSIVFSLFGFNFDPMSPARKDIQYFNKELTGKIKTYQGAHRKMSFAEHGNSSLRPVIFVHGSPGSKDAWYSFLLDTKLQAKFHLLAVDRPGFGLSEAGTTETSVKKQAEDVWKIMNQNKSGKKVILIGHSYGGAVIARIAMDHPDKIESLIFVASSVDPKLEETKFIQHIGNIRGIRSLIPDFLRVCNEEILALKDDLEKMIPEWTKIKAEVHVVHGEQDDLVPVENVTFIQKLLPGNQIKSINIIKGMNHFIPWHKAETINSILYGVDEK